MSNPAKAHLSELAMTLGFVGVLALVVVPLPPMLLDLLLAGSLCLSVMIFLVAFYVEKPLDFSSFPSLLLMVTLLRLALNVASTRLILMNGASGADAAGGVIKAFGAYAVGNNFVVGGVVFLILVIINFIVITKGAERISEVGARFTLDSMPGKQMAIDADLGAGIIDEHEARSRRKGVEREADFHGSMDGASKFVRGDAIAGLMIVGINIVGGIIIGVAQEGMSAGDAATSYTTLSIGDGLVSQIPALLISTAAALLITRQSDTALGSALASQLMSRRRPLTVAAVVVAVVAMVPGMPTLIFLSLAGIIGFAAKRAAPPSDASQHETTTSAEGMASASTKPNELQSERAEVEALLPVPLLSLEVGLDMLPMVDADRGGELLSRIGSLRKQTAADLGIIVPPIHIRDDLRLRPGAYRIALSGISVGSGEIRANRVLAIDPSGKGTRNIQGHDTTEPTFGLPAKWIALNDRGQAEAAGCTVVDASAMVATHLTEVIRRHAAELFGRAEAQELLDLAAKQNSRVIEELVPQLLSLGGLIQVFKNLLSEGVAIRDMRTILESLADNATTTKDPNELTECVRRRLMRRITNSNLNDSGTLKAMVLDPSAEQMFRGTRGADPLALANLTSEIERQTRLLIERDEPTILVVAPDLRRTVAEVAARHIPGLVVLSYREIDPSVPFVTHSVIKALEQAA